jgi:hypothetical protein
VTYKNKYNQKFKIKVVMQSYAKKIINELKPLLANPDKGLQTVLAQRMNKRYGSRSDKYEPVLRNMDYEGGTVSKMSLDEVMKNYTASQKKALILQIYFSDRMTYSMANGGDYTSHRKSNVQFKKLWNGTFKGVCADGAKMGYDICQYLGVKAYYAESHKYLNHAWCNIWVTDKNGVSYWHGIHTTSFAYHLKSSVPKDCDLTKAKLNKYICRPNAQTRFFAMPKRNSKKPTSTTAPSVSTQAPIQTPATQVTPKPSPTTTTVIFNTPEP